MPWRLQLQGGGRGGLVERSWPRSWKIPGSKPDSTVWGLLPAKSQAVAIRHPAGAVREPGVRSPRWPGGKTLALGLEDSRF
ncbi:hypothetical protein AVEN_139906-1 [Araneus ventricosus]|uniref:Uncharacterized protein n=1 Tax=Araneus ventricosus TaxID=182803 RepID=A0A4Y2JD45_ARAVE|nr:hypothetical protein AVEN_139906-1 [Araneus ventricosus]